VAFLGLIDPFIPGVEMPEPDDWRRDFSDFISVVIPGANPDVIAGDSSMHTASEESGPAIVSLLERLLQAERKREREDGEHTEGYAGMGIDELAHTFTVARQLKALSLHSSALTALQGKATCWWAAGRPASERQALAAQIAQDTMRFIEVEADHFTIVRNELLLLGIKAALAAIPAPLPEIRIVE
jgi:hypothetical protein